MAYTVKQVADLAGITVRTLHHYDDIGLLKPSGATPAGYRLYSGPDLERLQQILFFRELGFRLQEIKEIIDRPGFDRKQALKNHRQILVERQERLQRLIRSIDRTLEAIERGDSMNENELFDGFDVARYEEEAARQRWGDTEAYRESMRRVARYGKEEWQAIRKESVEIEQGIAPLMDRDPADPEVQAWIARHHRHIHERFYDCPADLYRGLADLYVEDERFTAYYDKIRPGMARFMQQAMKIYSDTLEEQGEQRS